MSVGQPSSDRSCGVLFSPAGGCWRVQGLTEDVTINKFFDEEMLFELAKQDTGNAEYNM